MKKGKILKKISALFLMAALALAPMTSALADNNLPTGTQTGDITVHKYLRDSASTMAGDSQKITDQTILDTLGTPADDADNKAGFTLYAVPSNFEMEVTTTVADALTAARATPVGQEKFTDANGEINWTGLSIGYYVLVETTPIAGYVASPDAIIALPYALDDNDWNYDVHVYPKNVNEKPLIKTVVDEDTAYNINEEITWKYNAQVENYTKLFAEEVLDTDGITVITPAAYGSYKIVDQLDERLDFEETVSIKGTGQTAVTLTEDTGSGGDYKVSTGTNNTVTWTLTEAGLEKLAVNKITALEVEFTTKVNAKAAGSGVGSDVIKNGGTLEWKNVGDLVATEYVIEEKDKPEVDLFSLVIKKTNNDGSLLLNGATFKIAISNANAKAGTFIKDSDGNDLVVTTAAHPTDTAITGGWAMFAGLTGSLTANTDYYLVETIAPTNQAGEEYVRPTEPIKVTLIADTASSTVVIKNYLIDDPDIPAMWKLPLTGGMGTVIFYIAGAIVMIGSAILFVKSKSKKAKAAH